MKVTYSQITNLLQKFSSNELLEIVPDLFPEIGWEKIDTLLKKNRLSRQSKYISMTATGLYEETRPSDKNRLMVYWTLQFYDGIYHTSKDWHGIHLTDSVEECIDTDSIQKNVIRAYRSDAKDVEVFLKVDEVIYMMTIEKKTSHNGVKYKKPFFFVYNQNLDEPYALYSPKTSGCEDLVTYCCKGMGFNSYEEFSLFGKDICSLFGMIERNLNNSRSLQIYKDFHPVTVVEEDNVLDFTLGNEREKYAKNLLPGNTKLNNFSVESSNEWNGSPYLPELKGEKIHSALTFYSSSSIEEMFKEMIIRGMIAIPVPSYIANLSRVPTNAVELYSEEEDSNIT